MMANQDGKAAARGMGLTCLSVFSVVVAPAVNALETGKAFTKGMLTRKPNLRLLAFTCFKQLQDDIVYDV